MAIGFCNARIHRETQDGSAGPLPAFESGELSPRVALRAGGGSAVASQRSTAMKSFRNPQLTFAPEERGTNRLQLIEGLLGARDTAGLLINYLQQAKPTFEFLNVSTLVEELQDRFQAADEQSTSVQYDLCPNLPHVLGDHAQLRRLVTGLYHQARAATGESAGTITFRTEAIDVQRELLATVGAPRNLAEGRFIWLQIVDNGRGMDEKTIQHIFEPYYTAGPIGQEAGMGAASEIVNEHRGAIWATSAPGEGTAVHILLPCVKDP